MVKCDSYIDCNSHGDCSDSSCKCDTGWYGSNCETTGSSEWGRAWPAYIAIYAICYYTFLGFSLLKLYRVMNADSVISLPRLLRRLFRSPKHLSLVFICCVCILRGVWLCSDPLGFNNHINRIGDRVLYEFVFPFLFGMYLCVLLVWAGLYQGLNPKKSDPYRILRKCFLWSMILAFPLTVTFTLLKGYRVKQEIWWIYGTSLLGIGIVMVIGGFAGFGLLMIKYIKKTSPVDESVEQKDIYEITKQESTGFTQRKTNDAHNTIKTSSYHRTASMEHPSYEPASLDSACPMSWAECSDWINRASWNSFDSEQLNRTEVLQHCKTTRLMQEEPILRKNYTHFILNLTPEDKAVFTKIVNISWLSALLGCFILVLFVAFMLSDAGRDPTWTIIGLYISMLFEICSCFLILSVFTTQIKVDSKERLKFSSKILLSKHHEEPVLSYPKHLASIGKRLYFYFA
ncbi:unnamed protein product [Blepharisma stoltei]|uniref:EGF-like domain-containing protein n=1 Tax=Blepharisma stoltei TaxID=1481888 RepID=A0AAU9K0G9_9CILI|nr:unnamed protein product [Blepharisma stoltei]